MGKVSSKKEIKENILNTTNQLDTQIGNLVEDYINLTLREIESPGWAFGPRREVHHRWSWLKRKTSFVTVASQEDYVMVRDIKDIEILRQTSSPSIIKRITDEQFYTYEPSPTATGTPSLYRMWETSGVKTKLAVADTIDVVSSSTSDDDDTDLVVTVTGYVNNIIQSEVYTLNGTTTVSGSTTFDANDVWVTKSKDTVGTITLTENSGTETITTLGKEERTPIHKVLSLFPIPSGVITIYVHYFGHLRELVNDGDTPQFGPNWHYVVRLGALAKVYQQLGKETDYSLTQAQYAASLRAMVKADAGESDLVPTLWRHLPFFRNNRFVRRSSDDIT